MDSLLWLLRVVTPRNVILAALGVIAVYVGIRYEDIPRRAYRQWRYPPLKVDADPAIAASLERGESLRLRGRYRRIQALLEEARAAGINVDGQAAKARAAMTLDRPGYRADAHRVLIELEMQIPRRRQQYIPMDEQARAENEAWPGEQPTSVGSSDGAEKKKPAAARARRGRR